MSAQTCLQSVTSYSSSFASCGFTSSFATYQRLNFSLQLTKGFVSRIVADMDGDVLSLSSSSSLPSSTTAAAGPQTDRQQTSTAESWYVVHYQCQIDSLSHMTGVEQHGTSVIRMC